MLGTTYRLENELEPPQRTGFCIFIHTVFQGPLPSVSDDDTHVVFASEREAQLEIAEFMMTRLREFIDGERDFDDATTTEEYVVRVTVHPDGTFTDDFGRRFNLRVE